jgi:uncharacterized UBP type Zn finger protein
MKARCRHLRKIEDIEPKSTGCEACDKTGDSWVHLRMCMSCGFVGCCDQSKNTHARKHYEETGHPIIKSLEPGEDWLWCFKDRMYVKLPE